jgi:hypothetical protein
MFKARGSSNGENSRAALLSPPLDRTIYLGTFDFLKYLVNQGRQRWHQHGNLKV